MRGATKLTDILHQSINISIHAPHAGRDADKRKSKANKEFQSTRPMRGATHLSEKFADLRNFNPRAPCGARQQK